MNVGYSTFDIRTISPTTIGLTVDDKTRGLFFRGSENAGGDVKMNKSSVVIKRI